MRTFQYELFADYFQFYLQDEGASGGLGEAWTEAALARRLAVGPGVVGVYTARNMTVPVTVEVHPSAPPDDRDAWEHVAEDSLEVPSGRVVVAGCTDYFPDAARIDVAPGVYRLRASFAGLDTLRDNGLDGDDRYRVQLWPRVS